MKINYNIFDELKEKLKGDFFADALSRYLLSTDGSMYHRNPLGVVYPRDEEDVKNTIKFANNYSLAIHPRGAGSGLTGGSLGEGIVIDFTRYMNRLIELNIDEKYFICEPGFRGGELNKILENVNLYFPPDPSSFDYASFGGMFSTNASGAHSSKYGNISDYLLDADIILANGEKINLSAISKLEFEELPTYLQEIYKLYIENIELIEDSYPPVKNNVSGYNLRKLVVNERLFLHTLFTGSEGTLGIATKLKFKLIDKPKHDTLLIAYFNDIFSSTKAVNIGLQFEPSGIEIMDKSLLRLAKSTDETLTNSISEDADNVLLFEFDGYDKESVINEAKKVYDLIVKNKLTDNIYLATNKKEQDNFRAIRKAAVPILYKLKGDKKIVALVEDAAIPPTKLDKYFEGIYQIFNQHLVDFVIYGHIAKGLLHTRPLLNLKSAEDVRLLKIIADEFFDLIRSLGGTISGEHGDGRIRSYYVKLQYPKIFHLFKEVKNILDQKNIFNPLLKLTDDEYLIAKDLRYGTTYKAKDIFNKNLLWLEDFISETEKCHGCSKCTTIDASVRMCPVYKFTRDERATPKAKANILRALISGAIDDNDIYKSELQKVMNFCISCESCHFECPSNVNIPKIATEAKSQYYRKFSIPLHYKLITKVDTFTKWARKFAKISNFVTKYYYIKKAFEPIIHISPQRKYPSISTKSLFDQINDFEGNGEKKVLFFAGCYYSYFEPTVGLKTVEILKNIGFTVITPRQYCCGVPMIPKGMTYAAKERIYKNLESWGNLIDDVDNIVVSCSSCGLALMSEWSNFINSSRVNKIKDKTIHITKLLDRYIDYLYIEDQSNKAYHIPCHLKVQKDSNATANLINNLDKNDLKVLDSNCCGMAGNWGLLSANYTLSSKIGKDLDDKIKESECGVVITDCPTCRMQIKDINSAKVLHPVELIKVK